MIGAPLDVEQMRADDVVVLEISSYQLEVLPPELGTCVDDALTFVVCEGDATRAVASGNVDAGDPPTDAEAGCRALIDHVGASVPSGRTLRTEVRALDEDTSAVYCLVSGPGPLPTA